MRIKLPEPPRLNVWYKWFAWRPVFTEDSLVWLETVERLAQDSWDGLFWLYRIKP